METLKEAFYAKYPENHKILWYFEAANGVECSWENLTKLRLQKYVNYMSERLSQNAVKTYCGKLKSVLTSYNEEVQLPRDYEKVLRVRCDESQHVFLTEGEIQRIIDYRPKSHSYASIRNAFLIGCLTGARHSDYQRFKRTNIHDGCLTYVSIKTHVKASIPTSPALERLIAENEDNGYRSDDYTDVYFNRVIRRICKEVGINDKVSLYCEGKFQEGEKWRFVASHTARRSFVTNLYRNGTDIYTISKLCGHTSVEMTKKYVCCGPNINSSVLDYFNNFK